MIVPCHFCGKKHQIEGMVRRRAEIHESPPRNGAYIDVCASCERKATKVTAEIRRQHEPGYVTRAIDGWRKAA